LQLWNLRLPALLQRLWPALLLLLPVERLGPVELQLQQQLELQQPVQPAAPLPPAEAPLPAQAPQQRQTHRPRWQQWRPSPGRPVTM
jgi:hypothetical protein